MPRTYQRSGKNLDPVFTHERAKKAAAASHSTDVYIRRLVDRAPELTDEQRAKLAAILATSTRDGEAA